MLCGSGQKKNPQPVKEAGFGKGENNLLYGCDHQTALCLPWSVVCPGSDVLFLEDHSVTDLGLSQLRIGDIKFGKALLLQNFHFLAGSCLIQKLFFVPCSPHEFNCLTEIAIAGSHINDHIGLGCWISCNNSLTLVA